LLTASVERAAEAGDVACEIPTDAIPDRDNATRSTAPVAPGQRKGGRRETDVELPEPRRAVAIDGRPTLLRS
jgi:hypothetical protein